MYKFKKQSLTLLAFLLVGSGVSIFSHTQTTTTTKKELLKSNPVSLVEPHYINDGIFDTSTDLTNDQMTCYLTSGSQTSNSITVNAEFSAANFVEWGDRNKAVYFVIDDEDWSGVPSDPSLSGKEMPTFAGYTSQLNFGSKSFIDDKTAKENFVIPSTMEYADGFYISNTHIQGGAVDFEGVDMTKFKVTNIVIPDTVLVVDAEAFKNVPDTVTISCVVEEKPYDWDADWINEGANVVWGYKDETVITDKTLIVKTGSNTISHITENSYLIGYINERDEEGNLAFPEFGEGYYPLTVQYETVNADDTRVENTIELELLNIDPRNAPYDAVGTIGSASLSVPIDIYLKEGQTVDFTSFKFYNIFVAKRDDTTRKYGPDTATPYSIGSKKRFANLILLDDILTCKFDKVSTFADYTLVSMKVNKVVPYYYETIAESIVEENRALIDSGTYKIRYTLYNFNNADFRVTYKSGGVSKSAELDIASPLPIIEINKKKGNDISFI